MLSPVRLQPRKKLRIFPNKNTICKQSADCITYNPFRPYKICQEKFSHEKSYPTQNSPRKISVYFPIANTVCKPQANSISCICFPGGCWGGLYHPQRYNYQTLIKRLSQRFGQMSLGKREVWEGSYFSSILCITKKNTRPVNFCSNEPSPDSLGLLARYNHP